MLTNLFDYEHNWEITGPKFFGKRKDFKPMRFFFSHNLQKHFFPADLESVAAPPNMRYIILCFMWFNTYYNAFDCLKI